MKQKFNAWHDVSPGHELPDIVNGIIEIPKEADDKIIAVAQGDPSVSHINDIFELPAHFISEMRNFFEDYKKLEKKTVVVEDFLGKEMAIEILQASFDLYEKMFTKK